MLTRTHANTSVRLAAWGRRATRYSGADIAVLVRDALMEPVRKVQQATHFKQVRVPAPDRPGVTATMWTPCSPGDPDAVEKSWMDVDQHELREPIVTMVRGCPWSAKRNGGKGGGAGLIRQGAPANVSRSSRGDGCVTRSVTLKTRWRVRGQR